MPAMSINESKPERSQSSDASKKQLTVKESDESRCVSDACDQYQSLLHRIVQLPILETSTWEEAPTKRVQPSTLNAITIPELIPGKQHHGRVLHGKFCVQPFEDVSVKTVVEDADGMGVRLVINNVLSFTASKPDIKLCFPVETRAAIKEPLLEVCVDGTTLVRVDNPADIFIDEGLGGDKSIRISCRVEEAETIRCEGNCLFFEKDWEGAVRMYSECIDMADRITKKMKINHDHFNRVKINRIVMLAYSNRAAARCSLESFEEALSDADRALEIDSKHVKTLIRKGKAAHNLHLFLQASKTLQAALELSPPEQPTLKNAKAITEYLARGSTGDAPSCSDYLGPVEIRRVSYGFGRRGLFSNARVKAGDILLASNPFAIVRTSPDDKLVCSRHKLNDRPTWTFRYSDIRYGLLPQKDLNTELANLVKTSKRRMAQLYSLGVYGKVDMEIPLMELFRPESEWVPSSAEKLEVDVALISDIVRMNSFQRGYDDVVRRGEREMEDDEDTPVGVSSGLWLLPSFANHSCAPSCLISFIGETIFFRAARDMEEGEELTIPYFDDLYETLRDRKNSARRWSFECVCERCVFEGNLHPEIHKISKEMPYLVEAVLTERGEESSDDESTERANWPAMKDIALVAGKIEALLHTCKVDPRRSGWIRASFLKAYESKLDLEFVQPDRKSGGMTPKTLNKCRLGTATLKNFNSAITSVSLPSGADYLTLTGFFHPVLDIIELPSGTSYLGVRDRTPSRDLLSASFRQMMQIR